VPILGNGGRQQYWITRDEFVESGAVDVEGVIDYLDGLYDPDSLPMFLPFYGFNESIPNGILELQEALDPERYEIVDLGTLMHLAGQVQLADPPAARPVNERWRPDCVRDLAVWSDLLNEPVVSVSEVGLRIEIPPNRTWAVVAIPDLLIPEDARRLTVRVADLQGESSTWIIKCYGDFGGVGHFSTWLPVGLGCRATEVDVPLTPQVLDAALNPMRQFQVGLVGEPGDSVVFEAIDFAP